MINDKTRNSADVFKGGWRGVAALGSFHGENLWEETGQEL